MPLFPRFVSVLAYVLVAGCSDPNNADSGTSFVATHSATTIDDEGGGAGVTTVAPTGGGPGGTNPCLTDAVGTLGSIAPDLWGAGYCSREDACGLILGAACDADDEFTLWLSFVTQGDSAYLVTGDNLDIISSTHGVSTGQTLTEYSDLPPDTEITMQLVDPNSGGEGSIRFVLSGHTLTIAQMQDPRFP